MYLVVQYMVPYMATLDNGFHNEQSQTPSNTSLGGNRNLALKTNTL